MMDHFCQMWENERVGEMGFIPPNGFLLLKGMLMDASVSPLARVLTLL